MLSLFKKKTVSTTERIYNWIQKHGNKQNQKCLSKFYVSMSRKMVISTRKLAVVIVSGSWPSSSQVRSKKKKKGLNKICFCSDSKLCWYNHSPKAQ